MRTCHSSSERPAARVMRALAPCSRRSASASARRDIVSPRVVGLVTMVEPILSPLHRPTNDRPSGFLAPTYPSGRLGLAGLGQGGSCMRAIVVHSLGAPDVLRTGHRPLPEPGPGEVLVRIHAIGVNFSDTERRRGVYDPPALPWTPGNEAAGVVEALGAGTDPVWSGRRVAFWAPRTSGCYAEYATVSSQ